MTVLDALLILKDYPVKVREVPDFRHGVFEAFGLIGPRKLSKFRYTAYAA